MIKKKYRIIQGEPFSLAFLNVSLPIIDEEPYEITKKDKLFFYIKRLNRPPIIEASYPGKIEKEDKDIFIVNLTSKETSLLPCLRYEMELVVDLGNIRQEVYTLVKTELEVIAK